METIHIPSVFARFGFWHSDPAKVTRGNGMQVPFDVNPYRMTRRDGDEYLMITAGRDGLPWGRLAKLIVAMLATEAVRTNSPVITLYSAQDAIIKLGIDGKGGYYNDSVELAFRKLLGCKFFSIEHRQGDTYQIALGMAEAYDMGAKFPDHYAISPWTIAENVRLFDADGEPVKLWADRQPLTIRLTKAFFEAAKAGIDLDLATWQGLSQSPIALDVYAWLNFRAGGNAAGAEIASGRLARQLGFTVLAHEAKAKIKEAMDGTERRKGIKDYWPEVDVGFREGDADLKGGPRTGWYKLDPKDGAIIVGTSVRHVAEIAINAQVAGTELAETSKRVAERQARAAIMEKAMADMAASDPADWTDRKVDVGGWGIGS